jgi:hypothetical protein
MAIDKWDMIAQLEIAAAINLAHTQYSYPQARPGFNPRWELGIIIIIIIRHWGIDVGVLPSKFLNNSYVVCSAYIMLAALTSLQSSSYDMQFTILINHPQPEHQRSVLPEDFIGHRQKEHVSCHLSCLSKVSDWVGELEKSPISSS